MNKLMKETKRHFRSDIHKNLILNMTTLDLQDKLLKRFNIYKQLECRIIKTNSNFKNILLPAWSEILVNDSPNKPNVSAFHIPEKILSNTKIQKVLKHDVELRWLISRIQNPGNDCIPYPTFPSTLLLDHPQFPYEPYEMQKMQELYGLIKWPYRESQNKRSEMMPSSEKIQVDSNHFLHKSKTGSDSQYIYSPSEMETSSYNEV